MTGPLPEPPELEPTALSGTSFGRARRGFEPTEVRSMMGRAADALRVWAERDAKMAERIAELSKRLEAAEEFDEARVTEVLGAETVRIVAAARDAAAEMRGQAQRESSELLDRSRADAEAAAEELLNAAASDRSEAARLRSESEKSSSELIAEATTEADRTLTEARSEAERIRAEASEVAEELTSDARVRHDEMIEAAQKILDERTEAAEKAASEIRAAATAELEQARTTAAEELERAREEARSIIEKAGADATTTRDEARDQGREMVEEARELRRQMLRDIAERTRAGRQKVEAAKAARSEVLRAIRSAGDELDRSMAALADHDHAMRRAADAAAGTVPYDIELTVRELEDQLTAVSDAPAPSVPTDAEPAPFDIESVDDRGLQTVVLDTSSVDSELAAAPSDHTYPDAEIVDPAGDDPDAEGPDVEDLDVEHLDVEGLDVDGDDTDELDLDELDLEDPEVLGDEDVAADGDDGSPMASVHDLFERLRSEESSVQDDAPSGGGPAPVVEAGASGRADAASVPLDHVDHADIAPVHEDGSAMAPAGVVTLTEADRDRTEPEAGQPETVQPGAGHQPLLDRRDDLLEPAVKLLGRSLKRLLSDEQNEVLDRVRRNKRARLEVSDLLGDADDGDNFTPKLLDGYVAAAAAGAEFWTGLSGDGAGLSGEGAQGPSDADPAVDVSADGLVEESLRAQVEEILGLRRAQLREVLEAHSEAGADPAELVDSLRSAYRDLRTSSVEELAGDLATGGFAAGTAVAAGPSSSWRWIPDNGGLPCADAEDNALEGPVACGAAFPTGDARPPAHPGCRCIVVPAHVEVL